MRVCEERKTRKGCEERSDEALRIPRRLASLVANIAVGNFAVGNVAVGNIPVGNIAVNNCAVPNIAFSL